MTIDRIGSIDPIQPGKKTGRAKEAGESLKTDSINISSEAVEKAELYRTLELAAAAPDVRADRVAELKSKINDPSYIDTKIVNATADRLIDILLG
jgi:negative regulator of flagellin synthesis FlgM